MTKCVTSPLNHPSWDGLYRDWLVYVDISDAGKSVATARDSWDLASSGAELQPQWKKRPPASATLWFEVPSMDFPASRMPQRATGPLLVEDDVDWHTAVTSLVGAKELAGAPLFDSSAHRRGATPVDVGPSLRAKIRDNRSYKVFIDAVVEACRSTRTARLGTTKYTIEEKRNVENPRWITITLTVWIPDSDFAARMDKWTEIRNIVDDYTSQVIDGDDKAEMLDIDSRFFISLGSKYD